MSHAQHDLCATRSWLRRPRSGDPFGQHQSGITLVKVLVVMGVVLVIAIGVVDAIWCTGVGKCTTQQCTSDSPCEVDLDGNGTKEVCIVGEMCTNAGTVCEDNWITDDCTCKTLPGRRETPGSCQVACVR